MPRLRIGAPVGPLLLGVAGVQAVAAVLFLSGRPSWSGCGRCPAPVR